MIGAGTGAGAGAADRPRVAVDSGGPSLAVPARASAGSGVGSESAARATTSVAMAVALGAVTMTFAALFLAYAIVRVQGAGWPPPGEAWRPRPGAWSLGATLAALAGSAAMQAAARSLAGRGSPRRGLLGAALAGLTFLACQTRGWTALQAAGLRPSSGIVASVVYTLTLFHALHVLAALVALLPLLRRTLAGRLISPSALHAAPRSGI